jgi:synaptobrevin family protein YKT6
MDEHAENKTSAIRLAYATKLDVGYFMRSRVEEFLKFGSRTVASRTPLGVRQVVSLPAEQLSYQCYIWRRSDGLCCVVIADKEYPQFTAFQVCHKVIAEFEREQAEWKQASKDCDGGKPTEWLSSLLEVCQEPAKVDKLLAIQQRLTEITEIMHKNIEQVLERGERLDLLVEKTEELSASSKLFLRDTKKLNSCCHRYFGV